MIASGCTATAATAVSYSGGPPDLAWYKLLESFYSSGPAFPLVSRSARRLPATCVAIPRRVVTPDVEPRVCLRSKSKSLGGLTPSTSPLERLASNQHPFLCGPGLRAERAILGAIRDKALPLVASEGSPDGSAEK